MRAAILPGLIPSLRSSRMTACSEAVSERPRKMLLVVAVRLECSECGQLLLCRTKLIESISVPAGGRTPFAYLELLPGK